MVNAYPHTGPSRQSTILHATGLDGENNIVPLAIAFVGSETKQSCQYLLQQMKKGRSVRHSRGPSPLSSDGSVCCFNGSDPEVAQWLAREDLCVFADRGSSLMPAIEEELFPDMDFAAQRHTQDLRRMAW